MANKRAVTAPIRKGVRVANRLVSMKLTLLAARKTAPAATFHASIYYHFLSSQLP